MSLYKDSQKQNAYCTKSDLGKLLAWRKCEALAISMMKEIKGFMTNATTGSKIKRILPEKLLNGCVSLQAIATRFELDGFAHLPSRSLLCPRSQDGGRAAPLR